MCHKFLIKSSKYSLVGLQLHRFLQSDTRGIHFLIEIINSKRPENIGDCHRCLSTENY